MSEVPTYLKQEEWYAQFLEVRLHGLLHCFMIQNAP